MLLTQALHLLQPLILYPKQLFLPLLHLLLQAFLLLAKLRHLLHALHSLSFRIVLDILQVHIVQLSCLLLLIDGFSEATLRLFEHHLLCFHLKFGLLALFTLSLKCFFLSCDQICEHLALPLVFGQVCFSLVDGCGVDLLDGVCNGVCLVKDLRLEQVKDGLGSVGTQLFRRCAWSLGRRG